MFSVFGDMLIPSYNAGTFYLYSTACLGEPVSSHRLGLYVNHACLHESAFID